LIKDPDILVLDEPTSALDSLVEKTTFDALPSYIQGKTLFIVTHRLATVQNTDFFLVFNKIFLVSTGTHREQIENSDFYRRLVCNQSFIIPT
jgi:ABC-type multidrug transport system fused ATPase/permease subunit